jgi:integrase
LDITPGAHKGEIRKIRRKFVDINAGRIELVRKTTKNREPGYLPISGDMHAELDMALSASDPKCPMLVQRDGRPAFDAEKSWRTACCAADVPEKLFHDLCRTAFTNMIEADLARRGDGDQRT